MNRLRKLNFENDRLIIVIVCVVVGVEASRAVRGQERADAGGKESPRDEETTIQSNTQQGKFRQCPTLGN